MITARRNKTILRWMFTVQALLAFALSACNGEQISPQPIRLATATYTLAPSVTPLPSFTPLPTPTPTNTPTPTLTFTPTPLLLAMVGTPLPPSLPPITYENAGQVSGLAEWYEPSVTALTWTPDGRFLVVSTENLVHFYDVSQRQVVRSLHPSLESVVDVAFDASGFWFIAGSRHGSEQEGYVSGLEIWRGPDWKPLGVMYGTDRALTNLAFSPDNQYLAVAYSHPRASQNSVDLWLPITWTISSTLQTGLVQGLAFSADARYLAVSPDRYAIRVFDLKNRVWFLNLPTSFTGAVNALAFSPDGFTLASGHYDGSVNLWDVRDGSRLVSFQTDEVIQSLTFSPDGRMVVTGGSYQNSLVRLWAAGSGELLRTLEGHQHGVTHLTFSPDSQYLVSASYDGAIRLWGIRP
jgi:WD40 repeat protein